MTGIDPTPAVILAGGRSLRMGQDKALVRLANCTLVEHVAHQLARQTRIIAINSNSATSDIDKYPGALQFPVLPDHHPGLKGPLAGILTAMRWARELPGGFSQVATVPIDSPFFPTDLIERLAGNASAGRIAIAAFQDRLHPVFGIWPVALADELEQFLDTSCTYRLAAWLDHHPVAIVDFPPAGSRKNPFDPFFNINTPDDLRRAENLIGDDD